MNEELKQWFYFLLGNYEGHNGSVESAHPALAEFVRRLEAEQNSSQPFI